MDPYFDNLTYATLLVFKVGKKISTDEHCSLSAVSLYQGEDIQASPLTIYEGNTMTWSKPLMSVRILNYHAQSQGSKLLQH